MKANFNKKLVKFLRNLGYSTTIVEHYNHKTGRKKDFDGYLDAIALNPFSYPHVVGIQSTTIKNISTRYNKITEDTIIDSRTKQTVHNHRPDKAARWLMCGNGIWIVGFETDSFKEWKTKIRQIFFNEDNNTFEYIDKTYSEPPEEL